MITASDLKGIMAMMPAFTKKDGDRIDATDTVDTDELTRAVDKLIRDGGVNVLTTTGSFGEFHTLLWDEHKKLIEATVAAVKKRAGICRLYESQSARGDSPGQIRPAGRCRRAVARSAFLLSGDGGQRRAVLS